MALAGVPSPAPPGQAREVELKHSSSFLSFVGSDVAHFLDVQERASNNSAVRKPGRGCCPVPGSAPSLPTSQTWPAVLYAYLFESDASLCLQPSSRLCFCEQAT